MIQVVTYGFGGYDPTKPNNNIVEIKDVPDEPENNVQQIAEALAQLPEETLNALKQALGL